jgi:hypothetical protein
MAEGVDYSGSRPNPLTVLSMGKAFIGRYFGPGGAWKHASRAECQAAIAVGLNVVTLAEGAKYDPRSGHGMGVSHARSALAAATAAGMPNGRPIYFAVDWDMQPADRAHVEAYMTGTADVLSWPQVGIYGGKYVVDWALDNGFTTWAWQTYAWSHGAWNPAAQLQQYRNGVILAGGKVDLDRSAAIDYGQWPAPIQTFGSAPDRPAPILSQNAWDYSSTISGAASDLAGYAGTLDQYRRATDSLRST